LAFGHPIDLLSPLLRRICLLELFFLIVRHPFLLQKLRLRKIEQKSAITHARTVAPRRSVQPHLGSTKLGVIPTNSYKSETLACSKRLTQLEQSVNNLLGVGSIRE
jgi:hypothetical protein